MSALILITGGTRSGKSAFAEQLAVNTGGPVLYIATATVCDAEMAERIAQHRRRRPATWETVEAFRDLDRIIMDSVSGKTAVILDCVTVMLNNLLFVPGRDWDEITTAQAKVVEQEVLREFTKLTVAAETAPVPVLVVTNELGMGVVPGTKLSRFFVDLHGAVNRQLAAAAREVYFCVSGIPLRLKPQPASPAESEKQ